MVELNKIPHINEISNHGAFAGAGQKKTATFRERYHQQNKVVPSLEEAIRPCTCNAAAALTLPRKGALCAGADADIAVFDPNRIADCATFAQPVLPPVGIDYVLIGGEIAAKDCRAVNDRLGRSIRK